MGYFLKLYRIKSCDISFRFQAVMLQILEKFKGGWIHNYAHFCLVTIFFFPFLYKFSLCLSLSLTFFIQDSWVQSISPY